MNPKAAGFEGSMSGIFCDKIGRAFETGRTGEMGTETAKYGRSGLDEL